MRSKFIVLSHYSNEAIGEFDTVGVLPGVYESLEEKICPMVSITVRLSV